MSTYYPTQTKSRPLDLWKYWSQSIMSILRIQYSLYASFIRHTSLNSIELHLFI